LAARGAEISRRARNIDLNIMISMVCPGSGMRFSLN